MEDNLTSWEIFVDETYLSKINEKNTSSIATGYYCIPTKRKTEVYKKYKKTVYAKRQDIEIKSTFISDQMNIKALQASRGVGALYLIQQSTLGYVADECLDTDVAKKAILLTNYLAPIEKLVKKIRTKVTTPKLQINICLDEKQQFQDDNFKCWANYLMNNLSKKLSTEKLSISIVVTIGISANSIGIQIADMLCGGFRKDYLYSSIEDHSPLIPFKYILLNRFDSAFEDSNFLITYALISLNHGICPTENKNFSTISSAVAVESSKDKVELEQSQDNFVDQIKNEFKNINQKQSLLNSQSKCKTFYKNNLSKFIELQNILGITQGFKEFRNINEKLGYEQAIDNIFHNFQLYTHNLKNYTDIELTKTKKVLEEIK